MDTIDAVVEDIVYRNDENGYTVLIARCGSTRVSAVGAMPIMAEGEQIELTGFWQEHPIYGRQIHVSSVTIHKPTTKQSIESFLASGLIRGIGPATAKLIVRRFGTDALDVLAENPERLLDISGIGPHKAKMIAESFMEHYAQREIMLFLQNYHVSPSIAMKIYKHYGDDAKSILQSNPYRLVDDIEGIGFKTADQIASQMGIDRSSKFRLSSGIRYVLNNASSAAGHCYLPRKVLIEESVSVLGCDKSMAEYVLDSLIINGAVKAEVIADGNDETVCIYDVQMWQAECETAAMLISLSRSSSSETIPDEKIELMISDMERTEGVRFHSAQRDAIKKAVNSSVCIITGGPGTGKTTIIKCILSLLGDAESIALAAPTGRAAKRMSEACGMEAKTIHRLLEYSGESGWFQRSKKNPLDCKTIIVDEVSMVDLFLMRALLHAIPVGRKLIMVGDADQLPSVGAGNVLKDMLNSACLPSVCLTEIFRQDENSMIVYNAHHVNHGLAPCFNAKGGDFYFERAATPSDAVEKIVALCLNRLPAFLHLNSIREMQVLSPTKKGECGVLELNRRLQSCFNPSSEKKKEKQRGDVLFREGDKVMQMKNNYMLSWKKEGILDWEEGQGVYNGDIGFLEKIDEEENTLTVRFDDDRIAVYDTADAEDLELAYCISIHKSQGSEFPVVVIPVVGGPPMLMNRNLLYTAITRAKRFVMLVGKEAVVDQMIYNTYVRKRYTALSFRIRNTLEELS